jgi:general secretion pathway protein G
MHRPSAAPVIRCAPPAPARRRQRRCAGLTLIELLLGVAALGVLAAIALPNYAEYLERGRRTQAAADIRTLEQTLARFAHENSGRFPESLADLGIRLNDPWGQPYQYLNVATARNRGQVRKDRALNPINTDYDLFSMGPDGRSVPPLTAAFSRDDIVRARNGQFVGKAEDF